MPSQADKGAASAAPSVLRKKAVYTQNIYDGGERIIHGIDHEHGGFVVSSERVGIAIQNFLNLATTSDIHVLHSHLLYAFKDAWQEAAKAPFRHELSLPDGWVVCNRCDELVPENEADEHVCPIRGLSDDD
jgi:hypothetical protein